METLDLSPPPTLPLHLHVSHTPGDPVTWMQTALREAQLPQGGWAGMGRVEQAGGRSLCCRYQVHSRKPWLLASLDPRWMVHHLNFPADARPAPCSPHNLPASTSCPSALTSEMKLLADYLYVISCPFTTLGRCIKSTEYQERSGQIWRARSLSL